MDNKDKNKIKILKNKTHVFIRKFFEMVKASASQNKHIKKVKEIYTNLKEGYDYISKEDSPNLKKFLLFMINLPTAFFAALLIYNAKKFQDPSKQFWILFVIFLLFFCLITLWSINSYFKSNKRLYDVIEIILKNVFKNNHEYNIYGYIQMSRKLEDVNVELSNEDGCVSSSQNMDSTNATSDQPERSVEGLSGTDICFASGQYDYLKDHYDELKEDMNKALADINHIYNKIRNYKEPINWNIMFTTIISITGAGISLLSEDFQSLGMLIGIGGAYTFSHFILFIMIRWLSGFKEKQEWAKLFLNMTKENIEKVLSEHEIIEQ